MPAKGITCEDGSALYSKRNQIASQCTHLLQQINMLNQLDKNGSIKNMKI